MRYALTFVALVACTSGSQSPPSAPQNHDDSPTSASTAERARLALRSARSLDYKRPIGGARPDDTSIATTLYVEACRAGDKPSCWYAMQLAKPTDRRPIEDMIAANCQAGHTLSCRALTSNERYSNMLGAAARSAACRDEEAECDRTLLRTECTAGITASCRLLGMTFPVILDRDALLARASELAIAGCDVGILSECALAFSKRTLAQDIARGELECEIDSEYCVALARDYLRDHRPANARDAFERACQNSTSGSMSCVELGAAYLELTLTEPAVGRGQALVDWACAGLAGSMGTKDTLEDRVPQCKRMTSHR